MDEDKYGPDSPPPETGWKSALKFFSKDANRTTASRSTASDSDAIYDQYLSLDNTVILNSEASSSIEPKGRGDLWIDCGDRCGSRLRDAHDAIDVAKRDSRFGFPSRIGDVDGCHANRNHWRSCTGGLDFSCGRNFGLCSCNLVLYCRQRCYADDASDSRS